ncbi:MAG: 50S ribosomal protein L11 methyltransferase [Synergistaceae bacterium]|nr:50S ribosomal protein L11 methyltransferase [Synergistaceae bacterium]
MLDELENYTKHQNEKNNYWWTIEYSVPVSQSNINFNEERLSTIAELTHALGSYFFTEEDPVSGIRKLFMRADYDEAINIDELCSHAKYLLGTPEFEGIDLSRCYKTSNQPWETQHFDAFPPLNVGKSLVVMAPWHAKEKIQHGRKPIYIFPASAFGTGYHESTRIALALLEDVVKSGDVILDVGTGTGILFIAALKMGAAKAIARDIDPATLDEAKRNMNLNGINPKVCELSEGDLLKGFRGQVNILTANILLNPNLSMLPDVKSVLKPKGYAIFSGMTNVESYTFISVLNSSGMEIDKELKFGDWWGCRAVKAWG